MPYHTISFFLFNIFSIIYCTWPDCSYNTIYFSETYCHLPIFASKKSVYSVLLKEIRFTLLNSMIGGSRLGRHAITTFISFLFNVCREKRMKIKHFFWSHKNVINPAFSLIAVDRLSLFKQPMISLSYICDFRLIKDVLMKGRRERQLQEKSLGQCFLCSLLTQNSKSSKYYISKGW